MRSVHVLLCHELNDHGFTAVFVKPVDFGCGSHPPYVKGAGHAGEGTV